MDTPQQAQGPSIPQGLNPEEIERKLFQEQLQARRSQAKKPKEGLVEKVKAKIGMKIITWIIFGGLDAVPVVGFAPIFVLRTCYTWVKSNKKGIVMVMFIFAGCIDLFDKISAQLASWIVWIFKGIAIPIFIYLEMQALKE